MEVAVTEPPFFDPAQLDADALEVWRLLRMPEEPLPLTVSDLMGFGHVCVLELGGVPEPVQRRIDELDPEHHVAHYMDAVRRARAPKPLTS
jgi:hypothetical protein